MSEDVMPPLAIAAIAPILAASAAVEGVESAVSAAEHVKAKAVVEVDAIKAILDEHAHDFIGRAYQIVSALKALVPKAEQGTAALAENIAEGGVKP